MPLTVILNNDPQRTVTAPIEFLGPGDISGSNPRDVIRVVPPPGALDAELNYFPAIEFDQADLPWRYTPRREDADGRLRPWMCLLTLTEGEMGAVRPAGADRPRETVLQPGTPLPPPDQLWAWAHVQVSGDGDLRSMREQPGRAGCLFGRRSARPRA